MAGKYWLVCPSCCHSFRDEIKGASDKVICPECKSIWEAAPESFSDGDGGSVFGYVLEPAEDDKS